MLIRQWWRGGLGLGIALLMFWTAFGTVGFQWIEGWSFAEAFYMTVITISTVGFGEIHPLSEYGRLFASFLIIGGLGTAIYTFTQVGQVLLEGELLGGLGRMRMRKEIGALKGHCIVCGFGRAARPVTEGLRHKKLDFCVIETDAAIEPTLQDHGYPYLIGDATTDDALEDAGIRQARAVLTLLPSDADNLYVTVTAKAMNPGIRVIARASDERGESTLRRGGADEVISPYHLASHRILQAATSPAVMEFMEHVSDRQSSEMSIIQARVTNDSPFAGKTITDARLREDYGVIVVALTRTGGPMRFSPKGADELHAGDTLVLIGGDEQLAQVEEKLGG